MSELKPCPFCGGRAEYKPFIGISYKVMCTECNASIVYGRPDVKRMDEDERKAAVAAKWNQRHERECRIEQIEPGWWQCSECGSSIDWDAVDEPPSCRYCPNCGAKVVER